ncbi:MAG: hypothetical protein KQ78_02254 [Candidatus Izimaplasma bacterium HR2]|nr:MAG: hypothetical protein KQ78_02254 [Candidatus Izimaplasma bacterium HR2]
MVKIDGHKIQEVKDYFNRLAEHEIDNAKSDGIEFKEDDIIAIKNKHTYNAESRISQIFELGPKKLFKMGLALDPHGWREGYTKPSLKMRVQKRRDRKKFTKKTRKAQRRMK